MGGRHAANTQGFHWKEGVLLAVAHPFSQKERKKTDNPREGWEDGTSPSHRDFKERSAVLAVAHPCASTFSYLCSQVRASPAKERKKTETPREGWEDGTPPPHRDFKERSVVLAVAHL